MNPENGRENIERERGLFMRLNAEGQSWEQVKENDDYLLWRSSEGRVTTWHKKHRALIIETSGSYVRRNPEAKSTGSMPKEPPAETPSPSGKSAISVNGDLSREDAKKIVSEFASHFLQFPTAYWHSADAMINEANGGPSLDDPKTFQKEHHLENLNVKVYKEALVASFKLIDPSNPDEFFEFEFRKEGQTHGEPLTGFKRYARKGIDPFNRLEIDLYKADFASPSMKPFVAMEVADMQAKKGKFAPLPEPKVKAPRYRTLDGENHSGSGFHFEAMGKRFIACSMHQFNNRIPKHMHRNVDLGGIGENDDPIKIANQAYKRSDVQILSYEDAKLDKVEPLKLGNNQSLSWGHPVYLYGHEKPVLAHVFSFRDVKAWAIPTESFMAGARSGSPVVCAITGNVIGVLLSADDPLQANWVGFQRFNLPDILFQDADPRSLPYAQSPQAHGTGIFGLPFDRLDRKDLQTLESHWMPLYLLHFAIGMSPKEAFRIRPSFRGLDSEEAMTSTEALGAIDRLPGSLAMEYAQIELRNGKLTKKCLHQLHKGRPQPNPLLKLLK